MTDPATPFTDSELDIFRQAGQSWRTDPLMARLFATLDARDAEVARLQDDILALEHRVYQNAHALPEEDSDA